MTRINFQFHWRVGAGHANAHPAPCFRRQVIGRHVRDLDPHGLEFLQGAANRLDFPIRGLLFPLHLFQGVSEIVEAADRFTVAALYRLDFVEGDFDGGLGAGICVMSVSIGGSRAIRGGGICGGSGHGIPFCVGPSGAG